MIQLQFGGQTLLWSQVAHLNEIPSASCELSVLTTDKTTVVLRVFDSHELAVAAREQLIAEVSEAVKNDDGGGGVIVIIIDDF